MLTNERIRELWENYSPTQGIESFAQAIEAEVRKEDEALIRQLAEALQAAAIALDGESWWREIDLYEGAIDAARARITDAELAALTERGAKAWPGIDPQKLREGEAP